MTRLQFERARYQAVYRYLRDARHDVDRPEATIMQKCNAARKICRCKDLLVLWERQGFWTTDNLRAYEMIYRNYGADGPVSAV